MVLMGRMVLRTDLKLDESLYLYLYSREQEVLLKVELKGDLVCEAYPYKDAFISIFYCRSIALMLAIADSDF